MNIKNKLFIALLLISPIMAGCASSSLPDSSSTSITGSSSISSSSSTSLATSESIAAPVNIALNERVITWDAVLDATGYTVRLNGHDEFLVTINELTLTDDYFGPLSIEVKTHIGANCSLYSNAIYVIAILHLTAPQNVRQDGPAIFWDAVSQATGYIVNINDVENFTLETSYAIDISEPTSVKVKATGRVDGYIVSSPFSSPLLIRVPLVTPNNFIFENGILFWNAITAAASYEILINDEHEFVSASNQVTIGFNFVGSVNVKVKAIASGDEYMDSSWGEDTLTIPQLTLSKPSNLNIVDNLLSFDAVANAEEYEIYLDGVLLDTTILTSYLLSPEVISQVGSFIQVKAISAIHLPSLLSEKIYVGTLTITNESELRALDETGAYALTSDIALTSSWTPLPFAGYFNGNGHTISSLSIDDTSASLRNIGFFSIVEDAVIQNLTLSGSIDVTTINLEPNIGGLAGHSIASSLDNISININISSISSNGIAKVGGVVGLSETTNMIDIIYTGDIVATQAITGGLIGRASQSNEQTTITRSASLGSIIVTGGEQSPTGGFIGQLIDNYMTIVESKAEIDVTGPNYVGGFIGYMGNGIIENSYSLGALSATGIEGVQIGGFVGRMEGYNNLVRYSIALNSISIEAGTNIDAGSFVGVTPGGTWVTIYDNCHYNNELSSLDRIGNVATGRGDGITGLTTIQIGQLSFNSSIWNFSGAEPRLVWEL